jgi:hypothetical protein
MAGRSGTKSLVGWQVNDTIGQVVKWPTTTDCKSVLSGVRWFESILAHIPDRGGKYERMEVWKYGSGFSESKFFELKL